MNRARRCTLGALFGIGIAVAGCEGISEHRRHQYEEGLKARDKGSYVEAVEKLAGAISTNGAQFFAEARLARGECYLALASAEQVQEPKENYLNSALDDFKSVREQEDVAPLDEARALEGMGKTHLRQNQIPRVRANSISGTPRASIA